MEDLKKYLIDKVLLFESDTLLPETEKVLRKAAAREIGQYGYFHFLRNKQYNRRVRENEYSGKNLYR